MSDITKDDITEVMMYMKKVYVGKYEECLYYLLATSNRVINATF